MADTGSVIEEIKIEELLPRVIEKKAALWRLVQICAVYLKADDTYELSYSFADEKNYFMTYRIVIEKETQIPSITQIYRTAFLYENEMKELFGVKISTINIDYKDKLYRIEQEKPFMSKEEK